MKNIQPGMNVPAQRRKIVHLLVNAPDESHRCYLDQVLAAFDAAVAKGQPQPAKEFLGAYLEEFDLP